MLSFLLDLLPLSVLVLVLLFALLVLLVLPFLILILSVFPVPVFLVLFAFILVNFIPFGLSLFVLPPPLIAPPSSSSRFSSSQSTRMKTLSNASLLALILCTCGFPGQISPKGKPKDFKTHLQMPGE